MMFTVRGGANILPVVRWKYLEIYHPEQSYPIPGASGTLYSEQQFKISNPMIKREDFIIEGYIDHIPEQDYEQISAYINMVNVVSRMTYKSIYVIDFYKWNFLYVSDNPFFLCGMSAEKVRELGYEFFLNHVPREDLLLLREITQAAFSFLEQIPSEEGLKYTFSTNFHLIQTISSIKRLINHLCSPIELTKDGKIWLALCIVSVPTFDLLGTVQMFKTESKASWSYNTKTGKWRENQLLALKEIEKDVILFSAQGYTTKDIAIKLCKSMDTIKSYKHGIFEKLGVRNMSEAILYAMNERLF